MPNISRSVVLSMLLCAHLVVAGGFAQPIEAGTNRSVTVRFPAFSLSPGERISGMWFRTSQGHIHVGCRPNRWTCDQGEGSVHCFMLHPTYAIGISGMLPEIIVSNISDDDRPSFEASVEFIDGSGKEYSKDIREDDLIVR